MALIFLLKNKKSKKKSFSRECPISANCFTVTVNVCVNTLHTHKILLKPVTRISRPLLVSKSIIATHDVLALNMACVIECNEMNIPTRSIKHVRLFCLRVSHPSLAAVYKANSL